MTRPSVSIVIPAFNEQENIKKCIGSIKKQKYSGKIEVLVVDDRSTDNTVVVAKKLGARVITRKDSNRHGETGKMIGFRQASGELAMYLDADIEMRGTGWLENMVYPLLDNTDIVGSFTRYYYKKEDPPIERYLSFDPLQRDPIYQYFSPSIASVAIQKNKKYTLCDYQLGIPPAGLCLYRTKEILKIAHGYDMFLELDFLVKLVASGEHYFAYVPKAGLYHHHVSSLGELVKKRRYNLTKVYLAREERLYSWIDIKSIGGLIKIFAWVVYANLIFPALFTGIYKSIKHSDIAGMYDTVVIPVITDTILITYFIHYMKRS